MKENLLKSIGIALIFFMSVNLNAQGFIWMKGSAVTNTFGAYGTIGVTGSVNIPGARSYSTFWKDASGNFWLFGGDGYDFISNQGLLNDLWKFDATSKSWTWLKGDMLIAQYGLYGTQGVANSNNKPGARRGAVTWVDATGNFYLFGGYGLDASAITGYLNDLWKYNPTTNQWTFLKGGYGANQIGNYGSMGVATASTLPGSREKACTWIDNSGNLWLFGGNGIATNSNTINYLNDLWKYDVTSNNWTWIKGSNSINQNGSYGTVGVSSSTNTPGARYSASTWTDVAGNFFLFGGYGQDQSATNMYLNDLWKYDVTLNEWVWLKGSNTGNQVANYGSTGISAATNCPGARLSGLTWKDAANNYWMSAGQGYASSTSGYLNDVWLYNATTNEWTWMAGQGNPSLPAVYGSLYTPNISNILGGRLGAANWIDVNNNLWYFGGFGVASTPTPGYLNDMWKYSNCVISPITITVVSNNFQPCANESVTLSVTGSNSYTWNSGAVSASIVINPSTTATYSAFTTNTNNCIYSAAITQSVLACLGINESNGNENGIVLFPNPTSGKIYFRQNNFSGFTIKIYDVTGKLMDEFEIKDSNQHVELSLNKGIYFYTVVKENSYSQRGKFVVE